MQENLQREERLDDAYDNFALMKFLKFINIVLSLKQQFNIKVIILFLKFY